MATATRANPISDLPYDWLTVLQSKVEGLHLRFSEEAHTLQRWEESRVLYVVKAHDTRYTCPREKRLQGHSRSLAYQVVSGWTLEIVRP